MSSLESSFLVVLATADEGVHRVVGLEDVVGCETLRGNRCDSKQDQGYYRPLKRAFEHLVRIRNTHALRKLTMYMAFGKKRTFWLVKTASMILSVTYSGSRNGITLGSESSLRSSSKKF